MRAPSITKRDCRLASGLVLFTYVAAHLANHALGLVSLDAAERGLAIAIAVWHSLPGTALLYGAAIVHLALAFDAVYERRTLRLPPAEVLRIVLGFAMPLLLIGHMTGTRLAFEVYGHAADYRRVVWTLWNSESQGRQLALLAPGWLHGCLGLHIAFGRKAWYRHARLWLFGAALLLPVLSALGFIAMIREIDLVARSGVEPALPPMDERVAMARVRDIVLTLYLAALGLVFAARFVRAAVERRSRRLVTIRYPLRTAQVPVGWSVLEASRAFGIAHASACGGRARCSTCRVRVLDATALPAPSPEERATLERIRAPEDVRLACQLRPTTDLTLVPLVAVFDDSGSAPRHAPARAEHEAVVLRLAPRDSLHHALPSDRLYAIERLHRLAAPAILRAGGRVARGDASSMLAIFPVDEALGSTLARALDAARDVSLRERATHETSGSNDADTPVLACIDVGSVATGDAGEDPAAAVLAVGEPVDEVAALALLHPQGPHVALLGPRVVDQLPAIKDALDLRPHPAADAPRAWLLRHHPPSGWTPAEHRSSATA